MYKRLIRSTQCKSINLSSTNSIGLIRWCTWVQPIGSYFLFVPPYAANHHPLLVTINQLQCFEEEKSELHRKPYLQFRVSQLDGGQIRKPHPPNVKKENYNHLLAMQPGCSADLYSRGFAIFLAHKSEFHVFPRDPRIRTPWFDIES